ncbi:hypothetical protein [Anaeromyxobacter diazotrophicus]|nr:hypothetical protein [Anaeromyxobacter diazotrophicus]
MKTLTELSGSVIRVAAAAVAEAMRSHPTGEPPEASPHSAEEATGQGTCRDVGCRRRHRQRDAPALDARAAGAERLAKEVIEAAVAKATGLSGDRLAMLHGAVEAAGLRIDDVRLVRVFGDEAQVPGATKAIHASIASRSTALASGRREPLSRSGWRLLAERSI